MAGGAEEGPGEEGVAEEPKKLLNERRCIEPQCCTLLCAKLLTIRLIGGKACQRAAMLWCALHSTANVAQFSCPLEWTALYLYQYALNQDSNRGQGC